jgi:hypothetical protein
MLRCLLLLRQHPKLSILSRTMWPRHLKLNSENPSLSDIQHLELAYRSEKTKKCVFVPIGTKKNTGTKSNKKLGQKNILLKNKELFFEFLFQALKSFDITLKIVVETFYYFNATILFRMLLQNKQIRLNFFLVNLEEKESFELFLQPELFVDTSVS